MFENKIFKFLQKRFQFNQQTIFVKLYFDFVSEFVKVIYQQIKVNSFVESSSFVYLKSSFDKFSQKD